MIMPMSGIYRLRPLRQSLKPAHIKSILPNTRANNYWHHDRLARLMPGKGFFQFCGLDILGGEKILADEQQDDVCALQLGLDFSVPVLPGQDFAVVPNTEVFSPGNRNELHPKFLQGICILAGIHDENFERLLVWHLSWM